MRSRFNRSSGWCGWLAAIAVFGVAVSAWAATNIDPVSKHAWGENIGWTNWRDANATLQGVEVTGRILLGYVWCENAGWVNVGDGTPAVPPYYGNAVGTDFGVNINPDGTLTGLGWAENAGWINFDGGALAAPANPARVECDGRLNGFAWGENIGWINLALGPADQHVALDPLFVPFLCDVNHDGLANGDDIQAFINFLMLGGADWLDVCSGDVEAVPDGMIDAGDVADFIACLLS